MSSTKADADVAYRKASGKYSVSRMSNAKWQRFFTAILDADVELPHVCWSYIDADHSDWKPFPKRSDILPKRFADGRYQPFECRWIESVFIPHSYRPKPNVGYEVAQDTQSVVLALRAAGQFAIEEIEEGIRILAYSK